MGRESVCAGGGERDEEQMTGDLGAFAHLILIMLSQYYRLITDNKKSQILFFLTSTSVRISWQLLISYCVLLFRMVNYS